MVNFERFGARGKGYSNEFYFSVGYVPIDKTNFVFEFKDLKNIDLEFTKALDDFDLRLSTNYNFLGSAINHNTNISIGKSF